MKLISLFHTMAYQLLCSLCILCMHFHYLSLLELPLSAAISSASPTMRPSITMAPSRPTLIPSRRPTSPTSRPTSTPTSYAYGNGPATTQPSTPTSRPTSFPSSISIIFKFNVYQVVLSFSFLKFKYRFAFLFFFKSGFSICYRCSTAYGLVIITKAYQPLA